MLPELTANKCGCELSGKGRRMGALVPHLRNLVMDLPGKPSGNNPRLRCDDLAHSLVATIVCGPGCPILTLPCFSLPELSVSRARGSTTVGGLTVIVHV